MIERESIADDDLLYRRLARHQFYPDGTVNSSAFKRGSVYETEISLDIARLTDPLPTNSAHALIVGPNDRQISRA
jgi:hypothetical protein